MGGIASKLRVMSSKLNADGSYDPSPFTIWMATSSKTTYKAQEHTTMLNRGLRPSRRTRRPQKRWHAPTQTARGWRRK